MRKIIAIIDTVALDIAGPLQLHQHEATAIRMFGDVAADPHPNNNIRNHIEDFQLVELGILDDDLTIIAGRRVIMTGSQYAAARDAQQVTT